MPTTPKALADALRERGVPKAVIKTIQPCIDVSSSPPVQDDEIAIGASKFGGAPDVPTDFEWPTNNDHPLAFLAQINLADVPHLAEHPLPDDGILSFWFDAIAEPWGFDPKQADGFGLFFFPQATSLQRHPYPTFDVETVDDFSVMDSFEPYKPCPMAFSLSASVNGNPAGVMDPSVNDEVDNIEQFRSDLIGVESDGVHRLLGTSTRGQLQMTQMCQLASNGIYCGSKPEPSLMPRVRKLMKRADDWQLLFQVFSDDHPEWGWGDMGSLCYWIKRKDLAKHDFARPWCVLHSF